MPTKRKLGVFWGQNLLYFVETDNNNPKKIFSAPIEVATRNPENLTKETTDGIKLTAAIQKALQAQLISDSEIALAIPPKDIIFRSFVIPHMQPNELPNVVEFEAPKYVPFRMEDLSYTFYPIPFVENKRKVIRILLVAIRRAILENYCSIFEHSGLRVEVTEPATISLIRALLHKRMLPQNKTTAIIEFANSEGRISIIDQNIPQFVREFQIYTAPEAAVATSPDILRARLFNEVKISFDYFNRQHAQKKIEKILVLSRPETAEILKTLGSDFNIPATTVNLHSLMSTPSGHELGFISAFGVCLRTTVAPKINFDLKWKSLKTKESPAAAAEREPNYPLAAMVAAGCAGLIFLSTFFANHFAQQPQQKITQLKSKLGSYESADIVKLESEIQQLETTTNNYKQIRLQSKIASFLRTVPNLLPPGTWISDLKIDYAADGTVSMVFTAHAYSKETNKQFELANNLVKNLKNDKNFSSTFAKIDLGSIEMDKIQEYNISRFIVSCK